MSKIDKFEEHSGELEFPSKSGWYWVVIDGYDTPTPCWFSHSEDMDDCHFLPAGLGDSSSDGLYMDDIYKIGPEIIEPKF